MEARVYAEDPARGFLPSTGRLRRCIEPWGPGIRVDSGVVEGGEVSIYYDPMIAKLCAHGRSREEAIARLGVALDGYVIQGPAHNIAFLASVLAHPRFQEGRLSTGFIAEEYGDRFAQRQLERRTVHRLAAVAVAMRAIEAERAAQISGQLRGWRYTPERAWVARVGGEELELKVERGNEGLMLAVDGHRLQLRLDWRPGEPVVGALIDGEPVTLQAIPRREGWRLVHGGAELDVLVRTRRAAAFARRMPEKAPPDTSRLLVSPMPGLIVAVTVAPGEAVKAGQELCILEAMKMENVLRAERDGTVAEVRVKPRDTVAAEQVLLTFA
jgi:propionyl-CoA carboxylase alpha chain